MTELEIFNSNKLIAEFMGVKPCKKHPDKQCFLTIKDNKHSNLQYFHLLKYHKSWDWLMPVIDKIESLDLRKNGYDFPKVKFLGDHVEIFAYSEYRSDYVYWKEWMDIAGNWHKHVHQTNSKIEAAYQVVVEFIKWYNSEKK